MNRPLSIIVTTLTIALVGGAADAATNVTATVKKPVAKPVVTKSAAQPAKAPAKAKPLIPAREWKMIREVAVNYGLSDDATWLLAAIRRHENGRPGLEFGIGGPMNSGHRAHRYQDGTKSFYVQALWAGGTVKKHYTGDVIAFGKYYNPKNPTRWSTSILSMISRLKAENNNKLPGEKPPYKNLTFP